MQSMANNNYESVERINKSSVPEVHPEDDATKKSIMTHYHAI